MTPPFRPDWRAILADAPNGYDVSATDREQVERIAGLGSATYGEVAPESAGLLLRWLRPGPDDVFFDLGSGAGRLVIQAVCETDVGRAVGVELSRDRHSAAVDAAGRLREAVDTGDRLELRCEDLRTTDLSSATLVYVAATSFPARLLAATCRRLEHDAPLLRRIVTSRVLPAPWDRRFAQVGELDLATSWSPAVRFHVHAGPDAAGRR